ncbi:MAG: serine/threonine protein kinase [Pirellulales bacterium]
MGLLDKVKSLLSGNKVDLKQRYELLREAVSGTMSKFYMARDRETDRIVGVKLLDTKKTADFEARLKGLKKPSEGEIAAKMVHPRIVQLITHGITTTGEQFLVMEFLEGQGLNSLLVAKSPLLKGQEVEIIRQAADALAAVHKAEFIHRDVCPRNFILSPDGKSLKLIDFGLSIPATPEFMQPGNRTGNPTYMAPEVIKRMATDHKVDIFALGIMAYELCTFEHPWGRGLTGKSAMDHATREATPIEKHRPQINPRLAKAISSCLVQNPAQRCPSLDQFLKQIQGIERIDGK